MLLKPTIWRRLDMAWRMCEHDFALVLAGKLLAASAARTDNEKCDDKKPILDKRQRSFRYK
jgi:hypothetical protein